MRALAGITLAAALVAALLGRPAAAEGPAVFQYEVGGRVQSVRAIDLHGDGRPDLVLLVETTNAEGHPAQQLVLLRTPARAEPGSFFAPSSMVRINLEDGPYAVAGAVSVGRFGEQGEVRVRFYRRDGLLDLSADGAPRPRTARHMVPTLLGRSPGRRLVFWDEHADLDGDGREECWFPHGEGDGRVRVHGGTAADDRDLDLAVANRAATDDEHLYIRYASIPRLVAADLDGDGRRELVAFRDDALLAFAGQEPTEGAEAAMARLDLPFARDDLGADEIHTPRIQIEDVDGDGKADLLVTVVTGNRAQLGSFRTRLLHYPGPFFGAEDGRLGEPRARIDTESVALHPRFIDLNGDGALDYVMDAITGDKRDLFMRVLGQEPTIWHRAFLFDRAQDTFHKIPYFSVERPYSRDEAVSNRFGISAYLAGDFDGDRHKDLLDLGNLKGVEILGAVPGEAASGGDPVVAFQNRILPRQRFRSPILADAIVEDLDGDGLSDAIVWDTENLYLVLPRRAP